MGPLSLLFSAWTSTAMSAVLAASPPAGPELAAAGTVSRPKAPAPARVEWSLETKTPRRTVAGFRMEGAPELEVVFGDIDHYKGHIDHFYELEAAMTSARKRFARSVHAAMHRLAKQRRGCPIDDIAADYATAREAGAAFRRNGAALEAAHVAIQNLDDLGESAGLTPDYRWKVNRTDGIYRQSLVDYEEMRAAFTDQLGAELRHRRCRENALLARAAELASNRKTAADDEPADAPVADDEAEVVPASTATFFVDNQSCDDTLSVIVDGTLLGQVAPGTKAAFQALSGRHAVCLIGDEQSERCGEAGTVRTAFVHDGWSLARHCE